jgi:hypothetical protein
LRCFNKLLDGMDGSHSSQHLFEILRVKLDKSRTVILGGLIIIIVI